MGQPWNTKMLILGHDNTRHWTAISDMCGQLLMFTSCNEDAQRNGRLVCVHVYTLGVCVCTCVSGVQYYAYLQSCCIVTVR